MLRDIYKELTGDVSGARTTDEGELNKRIAQALENEDVDIIIDLHVNTGRQSKYGGNVLNKFKKPLLCMSVAMVIRVSWQRPYLSEI